MELGGQLYAPGRFNCTKYSRGSIEFEAVSIQSVGEEKELLSLPEIELRSLGRSAHIVATV
jgi:hypothetical protein